MIASLSDFGLVQERVHSSKSWMTTNKCLSDPVLPNGEMDRI
jgi:hypothetical protein